MSQKAESLDEKRIAGIEALCASAAPFLEHLAASRALKSETSSKTESWQSITMEERDSMEGLRMKGMTIKYPEPVRQQFRNVNSDVATPGVSPANLAHVLATGGKGSGRGDPRMHQRGTPLSYMTSLTTALQKCVKNEDGSPDPIRTNVLWVVLEQMATDLGAYSECVTKIVKELRPALFSDDRGTPLRPFLVFESSGCVLGSVANGLS